MHKATWSTTRQRVSSVSCSRTLWHGCDDSSRRASSIDTRSVADGEALSIMLRMLQLIDEGNGEVLHRDPALARCVDEKLVVAEAEPTRALVGRQLGGRVQECPVEVVLLTLLGEKTNARAA